MKILFTLLIFVVSCEKSDNNDYLDWCLSDCLVTMRGTDGRMGAEAFKMCNDNCFSRFTKKIY